MRRTIIEAAGEEEESEINLTPMLDVVFIMLIFFIVTASFIKEAGIDVNRPDAQTREVQENAKKGAQLRGFVVTLLGGIGQTPTKPTPWFPMADLMELADLIGWAAKIMQITAVELDKNMDVPPSFRHASALFAAPFWEEGWTTDGLGPSAQGWAPHLVGFANLQSDILDVAAPRVAPRT